MRRVCSNTQACLLVCKSHNRPVACLLVHLALALGSENHVNHYLKDFADLLDGLAIAHSHPTPVGADAVVADIYAWLLQNARRSASNNTNPDPYPVVLCLRHFACPCVLSVPSLVFLFSARVCCVCVIKSVIEHVCV